MGDGQKAHPWDRLAFCSSMFFRLIIITHHPSPITHHPSPITHYPLPITHYPLPITHYPLPITHYPLPITHYPLPITHYPLPITHYPLAQRAKHFQRLAHREPARVGAVGLDVCRHNVAMQNAGEDVHFECGNLFG